MHQHYKIMMWWWHGRDLVVMWKWPGSDLVVTWWCGGSDDEVTWQCAGSDMMMAWHMDFRVSVPSLMRRWAPWMEISLLDWRNHDHPCVLEIDSRFEVRNTTLVENKYRIYQNDPIVMVSMSQNHAWMLNFSWLHIHDFHQILLGYVDS